MEEKRKVEQKWKYECKCIKEWTGLRQLILFALILWFHLLDMSAEGNTALVFNFYPCKPIGL